MRSRFGLPRAHGTCVEINQCVECCHAIEQASRQFDFYTARHHHVRQRQLDESLAHGSHEGRRLVAPELERFTFFVIGTRIRPPLAAGEAPDDGRERRRDELEGSEGQGP